MSRGRAGRTSGRCASTCRAATTRASSPPGSPTRASRCGDTGSTSWSGAASEERANELAERIKAEAPEGSSVQVVTAGAPHPVFVFLGAHTPGIARDLGL